MRDWIRMVLCFVLGHDWGRSYATFTDEGPGCGSKSILHRCRRCRREENC